MSMKFKLLIKNKNRPTTKINIFIAFKLSGVVFTMLINVERTTVVGILTCGSVINFNLS